MWNTIRNKLYKICDIMELIIGLAVIAGIIVAAIALIPELTVFWDNRMEAEALPLFLESIFNIVIGIEFLKMLCKPDADTIIEVLIFLVARHMIIGTTTAWEDLLSVISMGLLFIIKKNINLPARKEKLGSFFTGMCRPCNEKTETTESNQPDEEKES